MATIDKREGTRGTTYRARVKVRGRVRARSFKRLTDARQWAKKVEGDLTSGKYVPSTNQMRHTVADVIDRYLDETLPTKHHNKDQKNPKRLLAWWRKRIGDVPVWSKYSNVLIHRVLRLARCSAQPLCGAR